MPDSIEMLEFEIETLMLRIEQMDPDALLRLEKLWEKFRRRVSVERSLN